MDETERLTQEAIKYYRDGNYKGSLKITDNIIEKMEENGSTDTKRYLDPIIGIYRSMCLLRLKRYDEAADFFEKYSYYDWEDPLQNAELFMEFLILATEIIISSREANGQIEYRKSKSEGESWFIPGVMED